MKITDVRAVPLTVPLDRPQKNAKGSRNSRVFTLVQVETDAGISGLGDAYGDEPLMVPIVERLKKLAVGLDPTDIDAVWQKLFCSRAFWEPGGSVVCGISAIEVACWDIRGQAEGVSVCELLGGRERDRVLAYASDLHADKPSIMAELAAKYVEDGFGLVKTHIGAPGETELDMQRLEAMRGAIGEEVALLIDINTGFDRDTALERGRAFAQFRPFWYEEPLSPLDAEGHAWLGEELPFPIATGENLYTTYGFEPLWQHRACDYVMPDILRCGGIEQTRQICAAALHHEIIASPHNYSSGVGLAATLQLMAALPETDLLEFDTTGTAVYEELFVEPLVVEAGYVHVPTSPGLGVKLSDELIAKFT